LKPPHKFKALTLKYHCIRVWHKSGCWKQWWDKSRVSSVTHAS